MPVEKIAITNKLRFDIIEMRKRNGISSYDLSEQIGNNHSKFWLQNIENGKTKKISKNDLIRIYMILEDTDCEDDVTLDIERVVNQSIGDEYKQWYELIHISDEYSEIYDDENLMDALDELLEDKIITEIRNAVFSMSINQKQAALTAVHNFYYSLYKNTDLAFALMNIPMYGIKEMDNVEHNEALNDLLAMGAKYNDLVMKNKSIETIKEWNKRDEYWGKLNKQSIHIALNNFQKMITIILDAKEQTNPDMFEIVNEFNTDVTFAIERGQPNVMKHYLKSWRIDDGKAFVTHIKECVTWFRGFEKEYDLPFLYDVIDQNILDQVYFYLNDFGEIERIL